MYLIIKVTWVLFLKMNHSKNQNKKSTTDCCFENNKKFYPIVCCRSKMITTYQSSTGNGLFINLYSTQYGGLNSPLYDPSFSTFRSLILASRLPMQGAMASCGTWITRAKVTITRSHPLSIRRRHNMTKQQRANKKKRKILTNRKQPMKRKISQDGKEPFTRKISKNTKEPNKQIIKDRN